MVLIVSPKFLGFEVAQVPPARFERLQNMRRRNRMPRIEGNDVLLTRIHP